MKTTFLTMLIILISGATIKAQVLETKNWCLSRCNIAGDELKNTELIYLKLRNDTIRHHNYQNTVLKFPIRIGIVQSDTLDIGIDELTVHKAINNLNKSFSKVGFSFYIDKIEVIISDLGIEDLSNFAYMPYNEFSSKYDREDMISIYIFDHKSDFCEISETSVSCGRTGGFSYILSNLTNSIVLSKFDFADQKIVAHEFGHYFGLYHTFEEFQFGKDNFKNTDCDKLGDRICDTPPDPGGIFEVYVNYSNCEMLNFISEFGIEYKPLIENYMSYYKPCYLKEYSFTQNQIEVMRTAGKSELRKKFTR